MPNLLIRALSGIAYVALVLLACFSGEYGPFAMASIFTIFAIAEWMEFGKNKRAGLSSILLVASILISIFTLTNVLEAPYLMLQLLKMLLAFLVGTIMLSQAFHTKHVPSRLFHATFPLLYIGVPMIILPMIPHYHNDYHPWMLASVFILIWCNDTFAYLIGSQFGKHKLFPRVSPNKTWEGFLGGIVSTILGSVIFWQILPGIMPYYGWLGLAIVVLVFGTLGDLFESAIKRSYGLKDSGKFMPGHGGILDRIDSLLFALPMAYFYLRIYENFH